MDITDLRTSIGDTTAERERVLLDAVKSVHDLDAMDRAAVRMDKMREEMRLRVGTGEWAVSLTRETRAEG